MGILMIHPEKTIDRNRLPAGLPGWVNKQLEHFSPGAPRLILTGGCELYFPHILWLWKRGNLYVLPDNSLSDLAASLYHYTQIESANGNNPRMSEKTILVRLYQFYRETRGVPDRIGRLLYQAGYFLFTDVCPVPERKTAAPH